MSKFLKGYLMLKILNNDKFTTAQNRHFLVSLKIPILNTLPVRAKVWANGWLLLLPLQVGCSKSRKSPMLKLRDFGLVKLLAFNA